MNHFRIAQLKKISETPGIYQFLNNKNEIIYIGKAKNLKKRILSYFANPKDLIDKIRFMMQQAVSLKTITVSSEFEALLLEANLIKKYLPKYNSIWKDDKHYIYIEITKEDFPRILLSRKKREGNDFFGPFPSTRTVKEILFYLRRIFPYCTQSRRLKRPCFYTHLGLCSPCPGQLSSLADKSVFQKEKALYHQNIRYIKRILYGKSDYVRQSIIRGMNSVSSRNEFEKAASYKDKLIKLEYLTTSFHTNKSYEENFDPSILWSSQKKELLAFLSTYFPKLSRVEKIECYDISNISGKHAAGAMISFINGLPDKNAYRRFRIRGKNEPNDFAMLSEVLTRRFRHKNWETPDIILIDGGKPQVQAIQKVLNQLNLNIPYLGLAKQEEVLVIPSGNDFIRIKLKRNSMILRLFQRIRDESHRFAHKYHEHLRLKYLLSEVANTKKF